MSDTELAATMAAQKRIQANRVFRTTMIVEAHNAEGFEWALQGAMDLARAHVISLSMSKKGDPDTRVEVRTSHPRRSKQKGGK